MEKRENYTLKDAQSVLSLSSKIILMLKNQRTVTHKMKNEDKKNISSICRKWAQKVIAESKIEEEQSADNRESFAEEFISEIDKKVEQRNADYETEKDEKIQSVLEAGRFVFEADEVTSEYKKDFDNEAAATVQKLYYKYDNKAKSDIHPLLMQKLVLDLLIARAKAN